MAIYRGEGGATDVEPAPGDTEFAGGIIVEKDAVVKGNLTVDGLIYGDGSNLTNLPNDNVWIDNGSSIEFKGNGATTTQIWAENNGKYAKVIQKNDGQSYFKGDGATSLGTDSDLPVNIFVGGTNQLAVGKDSVYSFQPLTAPSFIGNGSLLTDLPTPEDVYTKEDVDFLVEELNDDIAIKVDEAPDDGKQYARQDKTWTEVEASDDTYTKAEIDAQQNAQDTNIVINNDEIARQQIEITNNSANITKNDEAINKNIIDIATNTSAIAGLSGAIVYKGNINVSATDAPAGAVSGDMYVNDYNELEPDTSYPVTGWGSITSVVYADRVIRTDTDWNILPASGGGSVPTDTYTKAQIDEQQEIQDTAISGNTSAIGTVSGQVGQNTEDIAELQDSIFFTSAYSADYPSAPNRDPENGNMYLQNVALFTYSYASATQIFASKTDESGNVRQFTAVKPGDSIVLNEVDSPNYGRYELVSVEDVSGSYVVMNVIPKMGQGTVVTGVKVAFQAFPQPGNAVIWTETGDTATYSSIGNTTVLAEANSGKYATYQVANAAQKYSMQVRPDQANAFVIRNETTSTNPMIIATDGGISTTQDITVNGVKVGKGNGDVVTNTSVGLNSLNSNTTGSSNTSLGYTALRDNLTASNNTAVGNSALIASTGANNTAIGQASGNTLTTGANNVLIGYNAQPSAPGVSGEVTIGNADVTTVRMGNGDIVYPASGGGGDAYTKAESDAIDNAQDVNISANTGNISTNTGNISANTTAIATKVGEAPVDGKQYGRKDATWTEVDGGTLDIDALPALPTELEGTDLFVTERTGTNYKVSADELKG